MSADRKADVFARELYVGDRYKRFGDLTAEDSRALAEQFTGLSGGGLEKATAPVASAWRQLAERMDEHGAGSVAELDPDDPEELAKRLRVIPPGGSWL